MAEYGIINDEKQFQQPKIIIFCVNFFCYFVEELKYDIFLMSFMYLLLLLDNDIRYDITFCKRAKF